MSRVNFKVNFLFLAAGLTLGGCKTTSTKPVQPEAVFYPAKLEAIDAAIERAIAADKAPENRNRGGGLTLSAFVDIAWKRFTGNV